MLPFPLQIKRYEKLETTEERRKLAREIYDNFIMKELLSHTHVSPLSLYIPFDAFHVVPFGCLFFAHPGYPHLNSFAVALVPSFVTIHVVLNILVIVQARGKHGD